MVRVRARVRVRVSVRVEVGQGRVSCRTIMIMTSVLFVFFQSKSFEF